MGKKKRNLTKSNTISVTKKRQEIWAKMSKHNTGDIYDTEHTGKNLLQSLLARERHYYAWEESLKSGERSRKFYLSDKYSKTFEAQFQCI